ncbi:acyl-CoA thioesterase [Salinispirillum sp. LH 10-3-1]|uniref:Acyl-CoA thioesterase n=1 Tax=Salinispirillum sp. LH 10-3-1 TaxID=2952525 RepID=A0AB38YDX4_9GAMM
MNHAFRLDFKVRDYECDLQGIVNNAVYQNYLEHARHEFLLEKGVDFAALSRAGTNLVVVRAELDYKASLTSGDHFWIDLRLVPNGRLRFDFMQDIVRAHDEALCVRAKITGAAINARGRPFLPDEVTHLFSN